ncbi:YdcF family protein [Hymenobacter crusticola]|uniref:DUF218 domain-containing protein n=1 Tax=Hymenobacter crusticola TaxID=1770526 RepID=A0A243WFF2_9BACT|nr:YdcF family protein [Hymenobacter crusticola]OUJ74440.1 hypothetical protein BXP70_06540 [Hymenobacter crusticola]
MFFLLSKFLYYVLMPATWLVALLVAALVTRQPVRRKRFLIVALVVALVGTNAALSNRALLAWELPPVPLRAIAPHDAAVLLTGMANTHKSPHDRVYLSSAADRLTHTLWLYRTHRVRRIIVSGGSGDIDNYVHTEAAEVNTLLRLCGVPQADILLEDRSRNTRENALYTKELLARHPEIKSLVLVTSAFHMRRAAGCFRKVGLNAALFPVDFRTTDLEESASYWPIPEAGALGTWSLLIHEITGYVTYKLLGYC